ncbi:MAG: DUF1493 family protein [Ottowia sp.]|nr:DUF1493 family protein [Ottowia sp.]
MSTEDVIALIAEETALSPERIQPQHSLNFDLGVDGDDAEELLLAYREKFLVDMSGFDFHRYFDEESHALSLFLLLWRLLAGGEKPKEPLFVRDLLRAAQLGFWSPVASADYTPPASK